MTRSASLSELLASYRDAAREGDPHALAAERRRLLPRLRAEADTLAGAAALRAAIAVLSAAQEAAFGPLPAGDVDLERRLADRLAAIPADSYRVPVLLVDEPTGDGVVAELIVELTAAPGRGDAIALGAADDAARLAARRAVAAATALLRRLGHGAEATDLEVAWQLGGARDVIAGPSLGLGLALAVVAGALGKPVPADVAVTGELDLDGRTIPVAGVERKVAAAREAGFTRVLVPAGGGVEGTLEVADVAAAVQLLWGLTPPRATSRWTLHRAPLAVALVVLAALGLGLLEVPALLVYPTMVRPFDDAALSDKVVLVTWSRDDDVSAALTPRSLAPPVDFSTFVDHKSYRATHPVVLEQLASTPAVVVFDAWFRGGDEEALAVLRERIDRLTREDGLRVILPARSSGGRWDAPDPGLANVAVVGSADLLRENPGGLVRQFELGRRDPAEGAPPWSVASLAVAARGDATPAWNGPDVVRLGPSPREARRGRRLLAFPRTPGFRHYAYADVYAGNFDPSHFQDAITIIGGRLGTQDRHRTPVGDWYGVELLALAVDNLLEDRQLVPVGRPMRALLLLGLAGAGLALGRRRRWLLLGVPVAAYVAWTASGLGLLWPWSDAAILIVGLALLRPR